MRYASAKKMIKSNPLRITITLNPKTSSVNPVNPVNPDSKAGVKGKFKLKTFGEKTRSIASLHYDILPPGAKGDFGGNCAARGLMINRQKLCRQGLKGILGEIVPPGTK